jgi:hypothetical protein
VALVSTGRSAKRRDTSGSIARVTFLDRPLQLELHERSFELACQRVFRRAFAGAADGRLALGWTLSVAGSAARLGSFLRVLDLSQRGPTG